MSFMRRPLRHRGFFSMSAAGALKRLEMELSRAWSDSSALQGVSRTTGQYVCAVLLVMVGPAALKATCLSRLHNRS
jgi:hypothetical protein